MSPGNLWQEFAQELDRPTLLPQEDKCFFAREYISRGGHQASPTNSLIMNFKKKPNLRGTTQWDYKLKAIQQFAQELSIFLPNSIVIAPIPSSKTCDHDDYDPRMDMLLNKLSQSRPDIIVVKPISRDTSIQAQHEREGRASVEEISQGLTWKGLPTGVSHLVLLDDVITVGRTYKACRDIIHANSTDIKTYGVFWARTVWPDDDRTTC